MKSQLKNALHDNQLQLTDEKIDKLIRYLELIRSWNRVFNLTSITDPREMIYLHLIDSLQVAPYLQGQHYLDVGSGAGLPGIPLAILNPQHTWVLVDKNSKKTRFLTQVIAELALPQVKAIHSRSEDFAPSQGFDSILSRAFGTLKELVDTTTHLLAPNGQILAMKGKVPKEELAALPENITSEIVRLVVNGWDIERHLIILKPKRN